MRMIGVDPGNAVTGYGVLEIAAGEAICLTAGAIRTRSAESAPARLKFILERLLAIIDEFRPVAMSVELNFVAVNIRSALRLGEARAVAMLAAATRDLAFFEYTPNEVKLTVAGNGHAGKAQVKLMVRRTLGLSEAFELADDAADGLALALCHHYRNRGGYAQARALIASAPRHRRAPLARA